MKSHWFLLSRVYPRGSKIFQTGDKHVTSIFWRRKEYATPVLALEWSVHVYNRECDTFHPTESCLLVTWKYHNFSLMFWFRRSSSVVVISFGPWRHWSRRRPTRRLLFGISSVCRQYAAYRCDAATADPVDCPLGRRPSGCSRWPKPRRQ